jgi:hypothetical protein
MQQVPLLPSARIMLTLILGETVLLLMLKGTITLLSPIADLFFRFKYWLSLIKNRRTQFIVILLLQISNINDEAATD